MSAYYNEIDRQKAAWLRELIKEGVIAPGDVDERSIKEVTAADIRGYRQCHFFAGVGVWSYALRQAGWPDGREVWTGSCPCQSFSTAGKRKGFDDERHLWPDWFRLIAERQPSVVFGEQSSSKDALAWLDLVQSQMEGENYAFWPLDISAAIFGTPHIRQRLYFVADADCDGWQGRATGEGKLGEAESTWTSAVGIEGERSTSELGDTGQPRLSLCEREVVLGTGRRQEGRTVEQPSSSLDNPHFSALSRFFEWANECDSYALPGPVNGFWRDADWIFCTDGKWRAVKPGTSALAHGSPQRVGRLRGYGDCIVAPQAQAFIEAYMQVRG